MDSYSSLPITRRACSHYPQLYKILINYKYMVDIIPKRKEAEKESGCTCTKELRDIECSEEGHGG